ncbi:MAG: N-6 DNA methylase [Bacteroidota bacterium]|jgi:hypothetical protein
MGRTHAQKHGSKQEHWRPIADAIYSISRSCGRSPWELFGDFVSMSAVAIANRWPSPPDVRKSREDEYLRIVKKYDRDCVDKFCECLALLSRCFDADRFADHLGGLYMSMEVSNSNRGQFFTPDCISRLMASMTMPGIEWITKSKKRFAHIGDPACGAGGTMLAAAMAARDRGLHIETQLFATLQDVDPLCCKMAYLQLSMARVPAVINVGNSLTCEIVDSWVTWPTYIYGWNKSGAGYPQRKYRIAAVAWSRDDNQAKEHDNANVVRQATAAGIKRSFPKTHPVRILRSRA